MVIQAEHAGSRCSVDLTVGQVRRGVPVPLCLTWDGHEWQEFGDQDWALRYLENPRAQALWALPEVANYHDGESVIVLDALVELALRSGLGADAFHAAMESQFPVQYQVAMARLSRWLKPASV